MFYVIEALTAIQACYVLVAVLAFMILMEVLHTSSPAFSTYDELVKRVDDFPHFLDVLFNK